MWYILFFLSVFSLEIPNIMQIEILNFAYIIALILFVKQSIKNKFRFYKPSFLLFIGMSILSLLSIAINEPELIKVIRFIKFISFFLFFSIGYSTEIKKEKLLSVINISLSIFYFIVIIQNYNRMFNALFNSVRILNFNFINFHVQSGNITPTFFIIVMTYLYMNRKNFVLKREIKMYRFNLITTFIITITSYSRTAMLLGVLIIIFFTLVERRFVGKIKIYLIITLFMVGIGFIYNYNVFNIQANPLVRRIEYTFNGSRSGRAFDDSTMARLDTYSEFMEIVKERPMLGTGFDRPTVDDFSTGLTSAHNGFISYLYKMGFITTFLYLANLYSINRKLIKKDKRYLYLLGFILLGNIPQELFNYMSFYEFYYFIIGYELGNGGYVENGKD